jgi:hypothetical protein
MDRMSGTITVHFLDWQRAVPIWAGDCVLDVMDTLHFILGAVNVIGLKMRPEDLVPLPLDYEFSSSRAYSVWVVVPSVIDVPCGIFFYAEFDCRRGQLMLMVAPGCCPEDLQPIAWTIAGTASPVEIWRAHFLIGGGVRFRRLVQHVPLQLQLDAAAGVFLSWSFACGRRAGTLPEVVRRSVDRTQFTDFGFMSHHLVDAAQECFLRWLPEGGL